MTTSCYLDPDGCNVLALVLSVGSMACAPCHHHFVFEFPPAVNACLFIASLSDFANNDLKRLNSYEQLHSVVCSILRYQMALYSSLIFSSGIVACLLYCLQEWGMKDCPSICSQVGASSQPICYAHKTCFLALCCVHRNAPPC